ncbi:hypothetical protein, variant [Spizellomyces punctatus DAOM BR117]|nr:hypothetical protein, variant [Spizellomyces punctatus DAOM BR117]KNC99055.1 hypothetical protein, variant [Spizellomyces punctatus DAOM BR117]|eukprot:XP_016607095.1 hypothetical protein, variant [Spizellomyces punctatus DAOM BR117]
MVGVHHISKASDVLLEKVVRVKSSSLTAILIEMDQKRTANQIWYQFKMQARPGSERLRGNEMAVARALAERYKLLCVDVDIYVENIKENWEKVDWNKVEKVYGLQVLSWMKDIQFEGNNPKLRKPTAISVKPLLKALVLNKLRNPISRKLMGPEFAKDLANDRVSPIDIDKFNEWQRMFTPLDHLSTIVLRDIYMAENVHKLCLDLHEAKIPGDIVLVIGKSHVSGIRAIWDKVCQMQIERPGFPDYDNTSKKWLRGKSSVTADKSSVTGDTRKVVGQKKKKKR